VETLLGLACVLPLLELVQGLFKFAYMCDSFICDFMFVVRFCEVYLYKLYYDPKERYPSSHFGIFIDLVEHIHDQLCLCQWKEPTTQIEYIYFLGR
jgi:hypothetical protein